MSYLRTIASSTCLLALVAAGHLACTGDSSAPTATPSGAATAPAATTSYAAPAIYKQRCATCHGDTGKGDGLAAATLSPKPRDLQDAAWQDSVTNEDIVKIITEGGTAVGKSPLMPPQPDLKAKTDELNALLAFIRSLKK